MPRDFSFFFFFFFFFFFSGGLKGNPKGLTVKPFFLGGSALNQKYSHRCDGLCFWLKGQRVLIGLIEGKKDADHWGSNVDTPCGGLQATRETKRKQPTYFFWAKAISQQSGGGYHQYIDLHRERHAKGTPTSVGVFIPY